jgi:hypothetical protein
MMVLPFSTHTGFNAPCEPTHWKVENFLTGLTSQLRLPAGTGVVFQVKAENIMVKRRRQKYSGF